MFVPQPPLTDDTTEVSRWRWFLTVFLRQRLLAEQKEAQTTISSASTLWSKTIADRSLYFIEANVVGHQAAGSDRAAYVRQALVYRDGGGSVLEGSVTSINTIESSGASPWDCTFDVNGNDVRLRVSGTTAVTIDWKGIVYFNHRVR